MPPLEFKITPETVIRLEQKTTSNVLFLRGAERAAANGGFIELHGGRYTVVSIQIGFNDCPEIGLRFAGPML